MRGSWGIARLLEGEGRTLPEKSVVVNECGAQRVWCQRSVGKERGRRRISRREEAKPSAERPENPSPSRSEKGDKTRGDKTRGGKRLELEPVAAVSSYEVL